MDKTLDKTAGRSGVRIPGRGKGSQRTTAVDPRVNDPLFFIVTDNHLNHLFRTIS